MSDDVLDILNQYMDSKIKGVDAQLDVVTKKSSDSAPDEVVPLVEKIKQPETTQSDESDDDLDFGDMPNGKIRYEKQKEKLRKLQEEVEALKKSATKPEDVIDPNANLSDEEKAALAKEKELENLKNEVNQMKDKEVLQSLKEREERFWSNYTKEERLKYAPMMELEIRRADLIEHVISGKITLGQVMAMVNPEAAKKVAHVQDSKGVFGKNNSSTPARSTPAKDSGFDVGRKVLEMPNATNEQRKQAIHVMTKDLISDFISL